MNQNTEYERFTQEIYQQLVNSDVVNTWLIVYTNTTVLSYALINADSCILFIISWCWQPFNQ